ncbi:MAG TPA: FecR domain-containing protein [Nannocystaceae bacterium]|nr:FecR domain-containing protein [Nannocystaceae bacterium]
MSDEYLWDKSGPPDPEIVALERALAGVDPPSAVHMPIVARRRRSIAVAVFALAAALVLAIGGWWWSKPAEIEALPIATDDVPRAEEVVPRVPEQPLREPAPDETPLPPPRKHAPKPDAGGWIETQDEGSRRLAIASIGYVELDPHTRMRELASGPDEHRYELVRGRIHASVTAPPRVFVVETPAATAVDLGCQYTLEVDEHGTSRLEVSVGFVSLEHGGRECIVPAGASCETRKGGRVGTTVRLEASEAMRDAVRTLDRASKRSKDRAGALATILHEATDADAATLWHVLRYASASERPALFDRLAVAAAPPETVTRERILAGDDTAMRTWWSDMGLGKKGFRSPR